VRVRLVGFERHDAGREKTEDDKAGSVRVGAELLTQLPERFLAVHVAQHFPIRFGKADGLTRAARDSMRYDIEARDLGHDQVPFVERLNLTIRQSLAYLARRTLAHARSKEKLEEHLELLRCYYNFARPHGALKFGREVRTPAMQAVLVKRRLTLREIFVCGRTSVSTLIEYAVIAFGGARTQATDTSIQMPLAA